MLGSRSKDNPGWDLMFVSITIQKGTWIKNRFLIYDWMILFRILLITVLHMASSFDRFRIYVHNQDIDAIPIS